MTHTQGATFRDVRKQTGFRICTTEVAGGVIVEVSLPNHIEGNEPIMVSTPEPIPADKVEWFTNQAKRQAHNELSKQRGVTNPDFISYLPETATRRAA